MATGDFRPVFITDSLLSMSKLGTYGLSQLKSQVDEIVSVIYGVDGWVDSDGTEGKVALTFPANDRFLVETGRYGVTASGELIVTDTEGATSGSFQFPNVAATTYYVYCNNIEVPISTEYIPMTGAYSYSIYKKFVGKTATPTAVVDNGDGTITFTVSDLFPGGGTYAGRKVYVWMSTPATDESVELCTVTYSGGANKISTTTKLGQSTVSTTAAHYVVALLGPTVRTSLNPNEGPIVGEITGNGPAATPVSSSLSRQFLLYFFGAVSNLFESDSHGSLKLRVYADDDDSTTGGGFTTAVPQITVYSQLYGTQSFYVDGDGNIVMGLPSSAGAATPVSIKMRQGSAAHDFTITHQTASTTDFASVSDRTMSLEGLRVRSTTAGGETALDTAFPKESWSGTGYQSLFGSMNSLRRSLAALSANLPVSGGTMSSGSSGVTPSTMTAIVDGALRTILFSSVTPADGTWYIYWNYTAAAAVAAVAPVAAASIASIPAGSILLSKIVRAAGTVTSVLDLRLLQGDDALRDDILVGDTSAGAHFATLKEAVDFMAEFRVPSTANAYRRKIVIISTTTETSTITLGDGVVIEGKASSLNGSPTVRWAFDDDLFDVTGDGIHIERVSFESRHTADNTGAYSRSLFKFPSGTPRGFFCRQVRLLDGGQGSHCHVVVNNNGSTVASQVSFEDCDFEVSDAGFLCSGFTRLRLKDVRVVQIDTAQLTMGWGLILGDKGKATHVEIEGFDSGISVTGDDVVVDGCHLIDFSNDGVVLSGNHSRIVNNRIFGDASSTESNTTGIDVGGSRHYIAGNDILPPAGSVTEYGIRVYSAGTGDYSIIMGNQTNGSTINGTNVNQTVANNRDDV